MKRFPVILLLLALVTNCLGLLGCADKEDPLYLVDLLFHRPERELALKKISSWFGRLKQENKGDVTAPPVKAFTDKVVPGLSKAFKEFTRDRVNRMEIVKLLSQMGNPLANDIFLEGLDSYRSNDTQIFTLSADALSRNGVAEALPKLIAVHENLANERTIRGDSPFTNRENEIDDAAVTAMISISLKNPQVPERSKVVEILSRVADTRDTLQDLRLNMKAVKALGQLGEPAAIPTLIRGIAMQGEVQKVGLGPFAFVSLQQIRDRDAVIDALLKFGRGKDVAFNEYFKEELQNDPMMKVPIWPLQQTIDFLGTLNYPSPKAIEFLVAEMNHNQPDDLDKQSAAKGEGAQKFDENQWAAWRRNWSVVALSQLSHKPVLDVVKERLKLKKGKGGKNELDVTVEEAVGFLRALGYLQYPAESCPLLLEVAKTGSETLRDKYFYYSEILGCTEVLPIMKQEYDKIDCKKIIAERFPEDADEEEKKKAETDCGVLKNRVKTYMDGIIFAKDCGQDLNCFLKAATVRSNPNIEAAIYGAYRLARGDTSRSKQLVTTLSKELENPVLAALEANIFVLDRLTPNGDKALIARAEEVRNRFVVQQAYKDRARLIDAFAGHVKARTK